jgi:hypothetical protein
MMANRKSAIVAKPRTASMVPPRSPRFFRAGGSRERHRL